MAKAKGVIYSCGYGDGASKPKAKREPGSMVDPEELRALVTGLDVTLIDCRAFPGPAKESDVVRDGNKVRLANGRIIYTRKGFWRLDLKALLGKRYEWRGDRLGGNWGGSPGPTQAGLDELAADVAAGKRLMLMCSEARPWSAEKGRITLGGCHRDFLIAEALLKRKQPIDTMHIFMECVFKASDLRGGAKASELPCAEVEEHFVVRSRA